MELASLGNAVQYQVLALEACQVLAFQGIPRGRWPSR